MKSSLNIGNYITVGELERITHIKQATIRKHLREGKLQGVKIAKSWLINEAEAMNWATEWKNRQ